MGNTDDFDTPDYAKTIAARAVSPDPPRIRHNLKGVPTVDLISELRNRDGVSAHVVDMDEEYEPPTVEGAAIVLIVYD